MFHIRWGIQAFYQLNDFTQNKWVNNANSDVRDAEWLLYVVFFLKRDFDVKLEYQDKIRIIKLWKNYEIVWNFSKFKFMHF